MERFSLPWDAKSSLLRRLRGLSFGSGGGVVGFSRMGFLRVVRGREGVGGLPLWIAMGLGLREDSETLISSVSISSVSESEASVSDMTRGDPLNGASRLLSGTFK